MGNRHLHKIECSHMLGTHESEQLKVTALNLFHPTASPLFQNVGFFYIATQSQKGEEIGTLSLFSFINDPFCFKCRSFKGAERNKFNFRGHLTLLFQSMPQFRHNARDLFLFKAFDKDGT